MSDERHDSKSNSSQAGAAPARPSGTPFGVTAPVSQSVRVEGSPLKSAIWRVLRNARFVAVAAVLAVSAFSLNATAQYLQLHFRKEPVPLPVKGLADEAEGIPAHLGPWIQATKDEPLDSEIEVALGTKEHINRLYVDTRIRPTAATEFRGLSNAERNQLLAQIQSGEAGGSRSAARVPVLTVGVTYYTGLVDTVAHIPERCYVGDGFEPSSFEVESVPNASMPDGKERDLKFRFIAFDDDSGRGRVGRYVGYFFVVNGDYTENPLAVREHLQYLREKYGYYAKIELMAQCTDPQRMHDPEYQKAAISAMKDFIVCGLPAMEKCLPDWRQFKSRNAH